MPETHPVPISSKGVAESGGFTMGDSWVVDAYRRDRSGGLVDRGQQEKS